MSFGPSSGATAGRPLVQADEVNIATEAILQRLNLEPGQPVLTSRPVIYATFVMAVPPAISGKFICGTIETKGTPSARPIATMVTFTDDDTLELEAVRIQQGRDLDVEEDCRKAYRTGRPLP